MNTIADQASRIKKDRHDWKLCPKTFQIIDRIWGPHHLDLFASHHNSQLHRYFSWTPDPGVKVINAFHQTWSKMNLWANPPWILILRILSKLIRKKATMTILVPWW